MSRTPSRVSFAGPTANATVSPTVDAARNPLRFRGVFAIVATARKVAALAAGAALCVGCRSTHSARDAPAAQHATASPRHTVARGSARAARATRPEASASGSAAPADASAPAAALPVLARLGFSITHTYKERHLAWRQVEKLNWQGVAAGQPALPPAPPLDTQGCPAGMVRVHGGFLVDANGRDDNENVEIAQDRACSHWRTKAHDLGGQCVSFDRKRWLAIQKSLRREPMDFCIDRYEFPDVYGQFPVVVVTFSEAKQYCKKVGKRLCTENEWTFACEGEEGVPYPYGYDRDKSACRIDVFGPRPDKDTLRPRTLARTAKGIDLAWRGLRSGASPRCKSPFGVYDMTGNVDEWTKRMRRYGHKMVLKGGHWGYVRQRCRPATRGHGRLYVRYDQGFRCCADAPGSDK